MKRNVFYFISLVCVWVLLGVSCDVGKTGADYIYFLFNRYYVPSKVLQGFSSGSYDVTLYGTFYFSEDWESATFRSYAYEYGEYGKRRFMHIGPPFEKPVGIIGMSVYQGEGTDEKDVSQYFTVGFVDYSPYIAAGYSNGNVSFGSCYTQKKLANLSEHDLKWLSQRFDLKPDPVLDTQARYTLKIALKGGKELVVQLSNKH